MSLKVQPTGKPRLEVVDAEGVSGSAAPGPSASSSSTAPAEPFNPAAPPPPTTPPPVVESTRPLWTAGEAAEAVAGAHNLAGMPTLFKSAELYEAWRADPKELDTAAPAIGRVLDKTPLYPGAGGVMGFLTDMAIAGSAIIGMEVRHIQAVRAATKRLERRLAEEEAAAARQGPQRHQEPPRPPAASYAPPPPQPTPAPAADLAEPETGFRFAGNDLNFLGSLEPPPDYRIRPTEAA